MRTAFWIANARGDRRGRGRGAALRLPRVRGGGERRGQPRKYAGKERDPETGYDYFGGRYYAARLGRFTTVDPAYRVEETLEDPQRWNRYAYVKNNPFRYTDPDGRILFDFQEFNANVTEALHFGQDGYGMLVPTVAAIAAIGSVAGDAVTILTGGVGGVLRAAARETGKQAIKQRTNKVQPVTDAAGPHTTWKKDPQSGQITRHETWEPNPRNPSRWDSVQSTDMTGRPHRSAITRENVPTPHTQGGSIPGGVRPDVSPENDGS